MKNHRTISLTIALTFNIVLCGCLCASASAAEASTDRVVVVMSVDGLANFYMDDPAAEMPAIRKLASEGAVAAGMHASDPTVTWPNHTTLVTGVSPARHASSATIPWTERKARRSRSSGIQISTKTKL